MTIDNSQRTFFNPDIWFGGRSEHALRFYNVYSIQLPGGDLAYETLSKTETPARRFQAVEVLRKNLADLASANVSQDNRNHMIWQFFMTTNRMRYLAVEDTSEVSAQAREFISELFLLAKDCDDNVIEGEKRTLVSHLCVSQRQRYGAHYPNHNRVPNRRAAALLKRVSKIDPATEAYIF